MNAPDPIPFTPEWPELPTHLLRNEIAAPPALPLEDVLEPRLARWIREAAEAKSAPPDYVFASLLAVAGATIGNARWVSPWQGWTEPPVVWTMCVGLPSSGKSPALDAVLHPVREAERHLRQAADAEIAAWEDKAELAKIAEATWKDRVTTAIKKGETLPVRPTDCDPGPSPSAPRLVVNDCTIERLAEIVGRQPRGTLQMRDELAGWLDGMQRYSSGSDRPFWLEAYGGRGFTVERIGRTALTVDRLTIGVIGGIQPDRLKSLLLRADDDGLLARFLPIWPDPAPLRRPQAWTDETLIDQLLSQLLQLEMVTDEEGSSRPWFIRFREDARELMDEFRSTVRQWEGQADGLMLSFIGKLPGLAARLSLLIGYLGYATNTREEPRDITAAEFGRAAHLVEAYLLPMARRAYAEAAAPKVDQAARHLVAIIREQGWQSFTSREVLRLERRGLGRKRELDPALASLEEEEVIRAVAVPASRQGGRPQRLYKVNPALHGKPS